MPSRPSGTVTFLFTDVEGSTSLLGTVGAESYATELDEQRAALREAFTAHGGVEVDTQGDSFFVAFSRAGDAVAAARAAQTALAPSALRVRIGIHTGEPLVTESGYVGMDVHRAARIAAAGHGGQVLLSQATRDLVVHDDVVDLGEHRLKDLTRPERIFQLGRESFPPLRSLNRSTLPEAAHPLIGRTTEQRAVAALLRSERLVTITGTGGTGKTRLALQLAAELSDEFPDGAHFVPLAAIADPNLVLPGALQALGVGEGERAEHRALLVLDNFEHVHGAARSIAEFLQRSPGPTVLVTSRVALHVSMEAEYPLDPLPPPAAIELFLDRARLAGVTVEPSPEIEEICSRLDGLPLALELAAARMRLLGPAALLARLDSRLSLLTRGPADVPERQRTLEATIAWSYDLLQPEAQATFLRLAVFAGTFDVDAAEAVIGADLDSLTTLADASLIKPRGDGRFLILETIRDFARNRLPGAEADELPARHADHYVALAESAAAHLTGPDAGDWLAALDADQANLRAALGWLALESPRRVPALAISLWRFWLVRGRFEEGQLAIERALRLEPTAAERAELLYELGAISLSRGATAHGRELFQDALVAFRELDDERGVARSLSALGHVAADAGDWAEAIAVYQEAIELVRAAGDRLGLAGVLGDLATAYLRSGEPEQALPLAAESAALQHELGNGQGEALALATRGYAELGLGRLGPAHGSLIESTRIAHQLGYLHGLVFSLNGLAALAVRAGEGPRATRLFAAAQALRERIGIEHDPDEALVADERREAAVVDGTDPDFDLDRAVDLALSR